MAPFATEMEVVSAKLISVDVISEILHAFMTVEQQSVQAIISVRKWFHSGFWIVIMVFV
jgi:hypothetical protein